MKYGIRKERHGKKERWIVWDTMRNRAVNLVWATRLGAEDWAHRLNTRGSWRLG